MRAEGTRILVVGVPESGKSYLLRKILLDKAPRVLHLDFVGEAKKAPKTSVVREGSDDTLRALAWAADCESWDIWAYFTDPKDAQQFVAKLVQADKLKTPSLAEMLGGLVIECSECSFLGNHWAPPEVIGLWTWGRHRGITLAMATQHPMQLHPQVRENSDVVFVFALPGDRGLRWVKDNIGKPAVEIVRRLPPRHALKVELGSSRAVVFDAEQHIYQRVQL